MPRKHIAQNEVGRKPEYYQDRQRFHPSDPDRLVKLYERTGRRGSRTEHHVPLSALRRRSRTKVPGRAPLSKERAQVNERLTFLANMGCNGDRRRQNGRRMMAANLFAYLRRKEAVSKRNVRDWMVANVPGFDDDTENAVWLAFHKSVNYLPTPRELGDATGYTNQEWDDDGCPSFIWPIDIRDDAEILEILEKRRRKKAAIAKSDSREANGARPRNRSKAALARFYRVNVKTITRMLEDGRLHPDTGDRIDPATGEVLDVFVPSLKEASYRERTKTSHRTEPARKAAPPPERQEDDMTVEGDTSAESADATRPIVAPGDDRPDDPDLIPTRREEPPAAPRTAPAADNNADAAGGPLRGLAPHGPSSLDLSSDKELPQVGASTAACPTRAAEPPRGATLADSTGKDGADMEPMPSMRELCRSIGPRPDVAPAVGASGLDGRAATQATETAAGSPESAGNRHAVPTIAIGPDDDDAETNAEIAAREFEKAAYRAERAAQAQSAAPLGKTTSQVGRASTGAPRGTRRIVYSGYGRHTA